MNILVYGAGVLGSALAHTLIKTGHRVTLLARGRRAEQLEQDGLVIRHYIQRKTTVDRPKVIRELAPDSEYDLIFVVMKYFHFSPVLPALAANASRNIVLIGNNPDAYALQEEWKRLGGEPERLAFGFQISAGTREDSGRIVSIRFGAGEMVVGALDGPIPFLPLLRQAFENGRYKLTVHDEIDAWLKNHIVPIVPLTAAIFSHGRDFDAIVKDKPLMKKVVDAMGEGFDVLEAAGYPMAPAAQARFIRRHKKITRTGLAFFHRLSVARMVDGTPDEIVALNAVFQEWKQQTGLSAPAWDALVEKANL
ncbi:2-dehydropantoate 2-reductase N-terminal domain-containing protein [Saccharibacillus sp. CPCC 101409]|uniref:ketopantoate reductase family protein n=1 Tax=Saccharibacillus sp. CPCC 101409 TaxID=3058041 RepID=UPI0026730E87|nr:2-dehydropantoate 2-reductase N-terminal domain-containing protein [Saccharibacillus sp. CPCC 101409]MDO3412170.1 2-dehydropantoate 2-reductase N-terminal domain-containing protein [Saccharibacillus sp. CPCC 101409]